MDKLLEIISLKRKDLIGLYAKSDELKNSKNDLENKKEELTSIMESLGESEYKKLDKKYSLYKMIPVIATLIIAITSLLFHGTIAPTNTSLLLSLIGYVAIPSLVIMEASIRREKLNKDHLRYKELKSKYATSNEKDRKNTRDLVNSEINNIDRELKDIASKINQYYENTIELNNEIGKLKNMRSQIVEVAIAQKIKDKELDLEPLEEPKRKYLQNKKSIL